MKRRFISLICALALLSSALYSCSEVTTEETGEDTETTPEVTEEVVVEEEEDTDSRMSVKDSLPDNLDFDGATYTISCASYGEEYCKGPDEVTGEIVDDAVIDRNNTVMERLNITFEYDIDAESSWSTVTKIIDQYVMSGDPTIGLFQGAEYGITQNVSRGEFVNVNDLDYLDFTQPWWNTTYMDQLEIGNGIRFFLVGDYFINVLQSTHVLYYNKTLYSEMFPDSSDLYDYVLDGTWTIDRLTETAANAYMDLNNNGVTDENDQLGYVTYLAAASVDPFMYCANVEYTSKDEEGYVSINMMNDRAVTLTEKVCTFFNQQGSLWNCDSSISEKKWFDGTALFRGICQLQTAEAYRDMEDDFGFLPYPKLDEEQESYHSVVADIALLGAIPVTSNQTDIAGAIIEALNAETYRRVTATWYEEALKIKYTRDNISAQVIDVIHDSSYTNFIFAYSSSLSNIGTVMRGLVSSNNPGYASAIAKQEKVVNKTLEKLIKNFEASKAE